MRAYPVFWPQYPDGRGEVIPDFGCFTISFCGQITEYLDQKCITTISICASLQRSMVDDYVMVYSATDNGIKMDLPSYMYLTWQLRKARHPRCFDDFERK